MAECNKGHFGFSFVDVHVDIHMVSSKPLNTSIPHEIWVADSNLEWIDGKGAYVPTS